MLKSKNSISNISKAKSSRKPLREISNGVHISSNQPNKTKIEPPPPPPQHDDEGESENALDRLLLVHSDLSNLIQQIDELVVQAVKVDGTSKKGKKEIDLFANVLSNMHGSLKSWIPRFQNLLTSPKVESRNQLEQSSPSKTFPVAIEETRDVDDSPEQSDLDSFVSPSPLVSWCPERTVESGRQLFLLTPLPISRQLSSKLQSSSRRVFARKMDDPLNSNLGIPPLAICQNTDTGLRNMKSTPGKCRKSSTEVESNLDPEFVSPPKFSNRNRSMLLMTPRLKMSPPKSCVLLEPIAESCQQRNSYLPKGTPFRVATRTPTATPSSSRFSESLTLKYPELFGTHQAYKSGLTRKEEDATVDGLMSPLKSCVLMEPLDKKFSMNLATDPSMSSNGCILAEKTRRLTAAANNGVQVDNQSTKQTSNQGIASASVELLECTPMWKEPENKINTGKQPGENTLKKELWTKFEAASTSSNLLRLNDSVLRGTSSKGFLDRLEEVCSEDISTEPELF